MNEGNSAAPRVALVHDWLNQYGGAENVLEELAAIFPGAPVYTSIYAPERMPPAYRNWPIHTSFLQRLPGIAAHHQPYLPLYPFAFGRMDLSGYDLVVSNKSAFCHGVYTGEPSQKRTRHVCYCLTPTRFLWLYDQYREREQISRLQDRALRPLLAALRQWDWDAAQRVDHFIAISRVVQERIRAIYGRESVIIYPPVDTDYFTPAGDAEAGALAKDHFLPENHYLPGSYYLIVSRLIPYKRIDLAVAAMKYLPAERLIIVGEGRDLAPLRAAAGPNVSFLGHQSRERVRELLRGCKAFLFPGLEDFGIAPLQALAVGRPVVAFAGGGALDTMIPGVTGELFAEQTVEGLLDVLARFDPQQYDPAACRAQAERFSAAAFRDKLTEYVAQVCSGNRVEPAAAAELPAAGAAQTSLERATG
ncbi:MAG TPA: glycosyltransferase [Caldilineaceae bacterium]|nr:glycosyltransferase [Caldilineaceae bacterium]